MNDNKHARIDTNAVISRMKRACDVTSVAALSKFVGHGANAIQSTISRGHVPYKDAAVVSELTGVSVDWLLFGEIKADGSYPPHVQSTPHKVAESGPHDTPPSADIIRSVVAGVETALTETGRAMSPENKADLVATLVDMYTEAHAAPSSAQILRLVRSAS